MLTGYAMTVGEVGLMPLKAQSRGSSLWWFSPRPPFHRRRSNEVTPDPGYSPALVLRKMGTLGQYIDIRRLEVSPSISSASSKSSPSADIVK